MTAYPFDCLLVRSRDRDLDEVFTHMLRDSGHNVEHLELRDVLDALQARTRPAVVLKNLDATREWWRETVPAMATTPDVTRRFGYIALSLYPEWMPEWAAHLTPGHDVTILPLPVSMPQLLHTVEQVGQRVARCWERS